MEVASCRHEAAAPGITALAVVVLEVTTPGGVAVAGDLGRRGTVWATLRLPQLGLLRRMQRRDFVTLTPLLFSAFGRLSF